MELFVKIVNGFQQIRIVTKSSILDVTDVLDSPLCCSFISSGRLSHKAIHRSILDRFSQLMPTLPHWLGGYCNYHVLPGIILSCKISRIYDNSPALCLFHAIVIIFFLFILIFAIILARKRDMTWKYRQKSSFLSFCEVTFHS